MSSTKSLQYCLFDIDVNSTPKTLPTLGALRHTTDSTVAVPEE